MSTIAEALAGLTFAAAAVPVCHAPYKGRAKTYVTYQLLGQTGQIYAEGAEAETAVTCAVNIYAEAYAAQLVTAVKAALEADGWIATVDMEDYDAATDRSHVTILAEREGAVYG